MAVSKWSNVGVAIGTLGTAQVISAISKAATGVMTYVGSDPSNGDYLALTDVLGMYQVNNRIFRGANVNAGGNTIELEGEATTAYDTFTSGNMQPVTFSTTMSVAAGITASGGDFDFIDTTTIHDVIKTQIPGQANPLTYSFDCQWSPADTALAALFAASTAQTVRALRITFANSYKFLLLGYVGCSLAPTGSAGELVKTPVVFTGFGRPTFYTT
jgi:hypothetical protein